jgi:hypothetical protein
MRISVRWLVAVLLLVPTPVAAHDHTADIYFAAFSYEYASNLWGILHFTGAKTLPDHEQISFVGDFARRHGDHDETDLARTSFMGGVRYTFAEGLTRHAPFAHVMIGAVRSTADDVSETDTTVAIGGGYEFLPDGDTSSAGWGVRVSADYVFGSGGYPRLSAGVVYRFDY